MEKSVKPNRKCLLYEYQLGNNSVITTRNICVAKGQEAVSYATEIRWFKRFRDGCFSLHDVRKSRSPMKIDVDELKHVLESGSDQSTCNIASKLGRSQKGMHYRFKRLCLVPKLSQ